MKELTNTDVARIEVSVRQTAELSAKAKAHPENQLAAYLERAFDRINVPYKVVYDLPPVGDNFPPSDAGKREQLKEWSDRINADAPGIQKDSNILLTNRPGGGMAYSGAKAAIGPGGTLTEDFNMREWVLKDDPRHCIFGCLHELAHNVTEHGQSHVHQPGTTRADDSEEAWYRTPASNAGDTNLCGKWNPERPEGYEKRDCLYLSECFRDHMNIK